MRTLSMLVAAAMLTGGFAVSAAAQDAGLPPAAADFFALAPSAQDQVTTPRGYDQTRVAATSNVFESRDAQRVRGDRW